MRLSFRIPLLLQLEVFLLFLCGTFGLSVAQAASEGLRLVAFPGLGVIVGTVGRQDPLAGHLRVTAKFVALQLTRMNSAAQFRSTR